MIPLQHILIRASAGTGKTFQLSNRYISLLASGVPPTSILATTFTRKAAGEIRDRILERLSDAVLAPEAATELFSHLEINQTISDFDFENCFLEMVDHLHRLNIGTLDSFFSVWTSKLALEFGLTPGWSILSSTEYENLVTSAISDVIQYGKNTDLSRLLILLNKGTVNRSVSKNVHDAIDNVRALYLQSTKTVWDQLLDQSNLPTEYLQNALLELEVAAQEAEKPQLTKGIMADIVLLRGEQFSKAIGQGVLKKIIEGSPNYSRIEIPGKIVSLYRPILEYLANRYSREIHHQALATYDLLDRFTNSFDNLKRAASKLEFSDATNYIARLHELPPELVSRLNSDIRHLLLDEFQDTSVPQWNAISHLVAEVTKLPGSSQQSLFCVGDTKQAIYGWRGGRREIFQTLSDSVEGIHEDQLIKSFRSSNVVLDFINSVFMNLCNHDRLGTLTPILRDWSKDFKEHTAARDLPGYVLYRNASPASKATDRLTNCLHATVKQVKELLDTNKAISIGVLLRKNGDIGQLIQLLGNVGIIASEEGGNTLVRFAPIQVILNWLHLLEFPNDSLALYQIEQSPLSTRLRRDDTCQGFSSAQINEEREALLALGLGDYIAELTTFLDGFINSSQRFRLDQLIQHADHFKSENPLRLSEFIQSVSIERFTEETSARVRVMTIHASKGLEFDAVILPHLESALKRTPDIVVKRKEDQLPDSIFPYRNEKIQRLLPDRYQAAVQETTAEQLQEVLCVLYVAMTRAAQALYMIGPSQPKPPKEVPVTLAGLIQMAVQGCYESAGDCIVHESGSRDWYAASVNREEFNDSRPPMPAGLNRKRTGDEQLLPTASPSSLEGGEYFNASALLRPPSHDALSFGTLVHQLFEEIEWWNSEEADQYLQRLDERKISWDDSLRGILRKIHDSTEVSYVLTPDFYNDLPSFNGVDQLLVKTESAVTSIVDGKLIRGFADRIVLGMRGGEIIAADIVDYKTDVLGEMNELLSDRTCHYQPQIAAYKATIAQMLKIDVSLISARLLFVTAGLHVPIETKQE